MKEAKENNLHDNTEFERRAFKAINSEVDTIYLDESELKKIHELDLTDSPDLVVPRDIFLIGCYVGQRFSDYSRIDKITILEDGTKVIKLIQKKTGSKVAIPVSAELYDILKKYEIAENEIKLPNISEQHLNRQIKKVGAKAKINEQVEIKKVRGGLNVNARHPKYSLITSHTARRSGLSNWYNAGIPSQYIMKLSGHKTEREFLKYLKLTEDDVAKILAKHEFFIWNALRIAK
jgi:integrase